MSLDMVELRSQLAPGWSMVNIALMVICFLIFWPLGLLMVGYIVWGQHAGLDLSRPESIRHATAKLTGAARAGLDNLKANSATGNGTPVHGRDSFELWRDNEIEKLKNERTDLEKQKAQLTADRQAFDAQKNKA